MKDVDGDDLRVVYGAGFMSSMPLSPERRAAFEAEERRIDEQLQADREAAQQERAQRDWLAARRGETRHTVQEYLAGYATAQEREDRREARRTHDRDCGCDRCTEMVMGLGSGTPDPRPKPPAPLPAQKQRERETKALEAKPATVGQLVDTHVELSQEVSKVKSGLGILELKRKLFRH